MRNRMFLYSMREGAGLMSFCFMVIESLLSGHTRYSTQLVVTAHASEKDVTVRHSLTDKLSLYFHTTHDSFVTFV